MEPHSLGLESEMFEVPSSITRQNMTSFQALIVLSEQKVAWFGCLHGSSQNWNRAGQKVDLPSSGSKLAHLAAKKRKVETCKFLSVQKFLRTPLNGA